MPNLPNFQQIALITNGIIRQHHKLDTPIRHILLDSRRVNFAETALFFAIKGQTHNGHQYIPELYAQGVRHFVVNEAIDLSTVPSANILVVNDVVEALQTLATWWRNAFNIPVVGITGSNGKTIVKEWLQQLWQDHYCIVRSPKSYNSQIGVPLSVWQMAEQHDIALFEAGISQKGEMKALAQIIQPSIGILTNIGAAHDKGFDSKLDKTIEKLQLFEQAKLLIYRADYKIIDEALAYLQQKTPNSYCFTILAWNLIYNNAIFATHPDPAATPQLPIAIYATKHLAHTDIQFTAALPYFQLSPATKNIAPTSNTTYHFSIPFTDDAYIENAIHCLLLSLSIGIEPEQLAPSLKRLMPVAMRLELKAGINNCTLINDAYSADLNSLAIALDFMAQQQQHPKKTLILSDILESGQERRTLYIQVAELLKNRGISQLIGIGKRISSCADVFNTFNAIFFEQTDDFLHKNPSFYNETILIKGARTFYFEKIVALLEQKNHNTVLEINLDAIAHNLKVYRNLLKPDVKVMVMVKALSYGSGSYEIANLLQYHKVDYLAVAYTDEGIALRQAGIRLPIMILNPLPETFDALVRYHLEPEIYSSYQGKQFLQYLQLLPDKVKPYPIHLKIDTGMHRLGFDYDNLTKILPLISDPRHIKIVSILTHLSASDEAQHDEFSQQQFEEFESMCQVVEKNIGYKTIHHILNSAGIARFPNMQADMVRLGLGIYGFDNSQLIQHELQQVSTLKTYISQIKTVQPKQTVGYGRNGKITQPTRIAIVSIGYADGLNRHLGNGKGYMLVKGKLAPIIGNVCMDMTMIDITHIDHVQEEDEVIVFGNQIPVQTIAQQLDTIPYEIITSVSNRVKRIYYQSEN